MFEIFKMKKFLMPISSCMLVSVMYAVTERMSNRYCFRMMTNDWIELETLFFLCACVAFLVFKCVIYVIL